MIVWLVVAAAGLVSFALRAGLTATAVELPAWLRRRLEHGAPAVIAALVATSLARPRPSPGPVALVVAAGVALAAARRFRSLAAAPLAGVLVLVVAGVVVSVLDR